MPRLVGVVFGYCRVRVLVDMNGMILLPMLFFAVDPGTDSGLPDTDGVVTPASPSKPNIGVATV